MLPSTDLQAFGGCHRAQLSQRWLPFGLLWYETDCCDILEAAARFTVALRIVTAPAPHATPCNRARRENSSNETRDVSAMKPPRGGAQRRMRRLYTRPRTAAVTQPKTRLKTMPSNQTLTDVKGWSTTVTEKREIHAAQPCEAGKAGKMNDTTRQITKRTTSAAEIAHPRATMLSGLFTAFCVFIAPSPT